MMDHHNHFARACWIVLLLALPAVVLGKAPPPRRATEILPQLKTGQWVQVESIVQKGSQARCTALRLLAGDFLDDDWSLKGRIADIDVKARTLRIASVLVHVSDNALIENSRRILDGISDLRSGMIVEVDGSYLKNGTLRAKEIDDESRELRDVPGINHRVAIIGKVDRVDIARKRITVMGIDFSITEKTQLKSLIR